jgi:hypothetical protein
VTLPTKEAQQSIKFALARAGRETAVIVNRLSGGTSAAEVPPVLFTVTIGLEATIAELPCSCARQLNTL